MSFQERAVDTVWMNGNFLKWDDAQIHVLSHVVNYGTGVFEGSRCYESKDGPAIFRLQAHIDRLYDSANVFDIEIEYPKEELLEATRELIARNDLNSCYIRHNISYGYDSLGLDTEGCPVNVFIAAFPRETYLGEEAKEAGAEVQISQWRRIHSSQFPTQVKAIGLYLLPTLATRQAIKNGYDEAILLDMDGNIAEGCGENIFIVNDGEIYTPSLSSSILPGITRDSIMQIASELGYTVVEDQITTGQLYTADEAFFCGTAAEITPIHSVDDIVIGSGDPGPITREIRQHFFDIVRGQHDGFQEWLDII